MTLLNTADKIYLGTSVVSAVYLGVDKVWPSGSLRSAQEDTAPSSSPAPTAPGSGV